MLIIFPKGPKLHEIAGDTVILVYIGSGSGTSSHIR
jgi:hypothetical protein